VNVSGGGGGAVVGVGAGVGAGVAVGISVGVGASVAITSPPGSPTITVGDGSWVPTVGSAPSCGQRTKATINSRTSAAGNRTRSNVPGAMMADESCISGATERTSLSRFARWATRR
jgi:hypothetical protein